MASKGKTKSVESKTQKRGIRLPQWLNLQTGVILVVIILFVVMLFWSEGLAWLLFPGILRSFPPTATPAPLMDITSDLPPELLETGSQTNAIVIGGGILVLIIVIGIVTHLRSQR